MTRAALLGTVASSFRLGIVEPPPPVLVDPFASEVMVIGEFTVPIDKSPAARVGYGKTTVATTPDNPKFGSWALEVTEANSFNRTDAGFSNINFGSSDFTIEGFIAREGEPSGIGNYLFSQSGSGSSSQSIKLRWYSSISDYLLLEISSDGSATTSLTWVPSSQAEVDAFWNGDWHHFAVVRQGNTISLYLDGIRRDTDTFSGSVFDTSAIADFRLFSSGDRNVGSSLSMSEGAKMDAFRVTVGTARYSGASFSPPSSALPQGVDDPHWANVQLLLPFEEKRGVYLSGGRKTGETELASDETGRWVTEADGFEANGVANRLYVAYSNVGFFTNQDFTFEIFGVKLNTGGLNYTHYLAGQYFTTTGRRGLAIALSTSDEFQIFYSTEANAGSTGTAVLSGFVLTPGVEYDLAVEREGNTLRFYVDGVVVQTIGFSNRIYNPTGYNPAFAVGGTAYASNGTDRRFYGSLRAVRLTHAARYAGAAYTPDPVPLPYVPPNLAPVASGAHKYWRIRVNQPRGSSVYIRELQFREAAGVAEVHGNGGMPFANGWFSNSNDAYKCFDGSSGTYFRGTSNVGDICVGFAFDAPREVVQVAIQHWTASTGLTPTSFDLECSDDGGQWVKKGVTATTTDDWSGGETRVFNFS